MMEKRVYSALTSAVFYKTREQYGELSNMASGFPIRFSTIITIHSSEALYQMMRYPDFPEVQYEIANTNSGMAAKMKSKKYYHLSRDDWKKKRVVIMRWCIVMKYLSNKEKFGKILLGTHNMEIVEKSKKDDFWGAIEQGDLLVGHNILGRLLMELRADLVEGKEIKLYSPDIVNARLLGVDMQKILQPKSSGTENEYNEHMPLFKSYNYEAL